jgi:3',5'-cyclic AMP phosphodiesterase CpdA
VRKLLHLSDIHFGSVDTALLGPLIQLSHELKPDLVVVSGDLTQRARTEQFKQARAFLRALPQPQLVVPGNHDIPLHNLFVRFFKPLAKYRRYITDELCPRYVDQEIAVFGLNTARSLTIKGGRINAEQVAWLRAQLCTVGAGVGKIVVTHHPFDVPAGHNQRDLVGRAGMAIAALADCGADLFLAGHLHVSHTGQTAKRYRAAGRSALVVQAGTATSTRGRGEGNSFNLIQIASPRVNLQRFVWQAEQRAFSIAGIEQFQHEETGWTRLQEEA